MGFFDIFKKKTSKKGEIQFHIGKCPFCDEQGWLKLARDDNDKVYIICDETIKEGYQDYIYILNNNEWQKLKK